MTETTFITEIKKNQLVLALYIPAFLLAFCQALLDPVLPLFAKNLDINYGLIGLVVAGYSVGMLLGDLPSGVFVRMMGRKRTMLLGLALSVLSTASIYWITSVPGVVFVRFHLFLDVILLHCRPVGEFDRFLGRRSIVLIRFGRFDPVHFLRCPCCRIGHEQNENHQHCNS